MALMYTPEKDTQLTLSAFSLPGTDAKTYTQDDIRGENGTVLAFICNHCPYVQGIIDRLVTDAKELQKNGIGFAAIMPNDTKNYPDDSFENMKLFADKHGFTFPYLLDESQDIARYYGAVCTPDLFGFGRDDHLHYRGRLDSAGPKPADDQTVRELVAAMDQIARTGNGPDQQFPSMGCSIKWKE